MTELLGFEILLEKNIKNDHSNYTLRYAKSKTTDEYLVAMTDELGKTKSATFREEVLHDFHAMNDENLFKVISSILQNDIV